VVDEAVDHGFDGDGVAEDLGPGGEALVGGHDEAALLVAGGDELEEQGGGVGVEGDVLGRGQDALRAFACRSSCPRPPNRTCTFPRIRLSTWIVRGD
jgi:hypothetical protein